MYNIRQGEKTIPNIRSTTAEILKPEPNNESELVMFLYQKLVL